MSERIHQPQAILDRLQAIAPGEDVVFTAIEHLKTPDQIRQFRSEYANSIRANTRDEAERQHATNDANSYIGFVIGCYAEKREISNRWFGALKDVSHPEFGRDLPVEFWKKYVSF